MRKYIVFGILAVMLIGFCLAETPEEAARRYRQWQKEDIHNERRFEHRDYRRSRFEEMQERRRLEKEREAEEEKGQKGQKKTALQTTRSQLKMLEAQVSELQELILILEQRVAILEGSDPNIYAEPPLEQKKTIEQNGNKEIIEVRKPAEGALKKINLNETGKGPPILHKEIDGKYIRIGPGMKYKDDDSGALFEEKLYVLEEKNGWIRFRVTEKDLGWSGWIRKDLTDSFSPQHENEIRINKMTEVIEKMVSDGVVHSFNIDLNQVRIDPLLWVDLTLENKQNCVMLFSRYFDLNGSTGRVEILSDKNDTKLATFSSWSGVKILK